jgi:hypothetical protein
MRLNGWQRIGIVASVIWAIGGPIYVDYKAEKEAWEAMNQSYRGCMGAYNDDGRCMQEARWASERVPRAFRTPINWVVTALVPIGLGWLLVYALVYLVRWIRVGFKP